MGWVARQSSWGDLPEEKEGEHEKRMLKDHQRSAVVSQNYFVMTLNISGEKTWNFLIQIFPSMCIESHLSCRYQTFSNLIFQIHLSGEIFEIPWEKINKWPDTLLGHPDREKYYNYELGMYFFDRNRALFEQVFRFYQCGDVVDFPEKYPADIVILEMTFFRIEWRDMNKAKEKTKMVYEGRREKMYAFFNDSDSSQGAFIYMLVELFFIVISILHFMLETEFYIKKEMDAHDWLHDCASGLTYISAAFFSIDLICRLASSLDHKTHFKQSATWMDIVALIPFFLDIYIMNMKWEEGPEIIENGEVYVILQPAMSDTWFKIFGFFRIARIARCFKVIRRSERLRFILMITFDCMSEMSVMLVAWIIGIITAGSVGYFAETIVAQALYNETNSAFYSIMEASWWAQITMSTIGYGDISPAYAPGMIVGTVIIFGSSVFTAIPMTIIIRRFSEEYEKIASEERPRKVLGNVNTPKVVDLEKVDNLTRQPTNVVAIKKFRDEQQSNLRRRGSSIINKGGSSSNGGSNKGSGSPNNEGDNMPRCLSNDSEVPDVPPKKPFYRRK